MPRTSSAFAENVKRIIGYAKRKGVRVIFMTQPYLWRSGLSSASQRLLWTGGVGPFREKVGQPYYSIEALATGMNMYNERLLRICRTEGVEYIDLASQVPKDISVFYDDVHFNEGGARAVAASINAYLSQNTRR